MTDLPESTPTDDLPEVTPAAAGVPRRRKRALWGVLAVLSVAVGTVAVRAAQDDPATIPVTLGAADEAASAPAADLAMRAYVHYVAGPDLPALGGDQVAYRLPGAASAAQVAALAKALGLEGKAVHADGTWHLQDGDRTLDVYEGAGLRWSYGSGIDGKTGIAGSADVSTGSASSPPCVGGPAVDCMVEEPATTIPVDLPTEAEAKAIAFELLDATGMDTEGADVRVDGPYDAWSVQVTPTIDGRAANELGAIVNVGPKGVVHFASGIVGDVERVGDVATVDTGEAIERLNQSMGSGAGYAAALDATATDTGAAECAATADGRESCTVISSVPCATDDVASGAPTTSAAVAPDTRVAGDQGSTTPAGPACGQVPVPVDPPEPIEVVLTGAEWNLMLLPASDGSNDGYLVPGYSFTGANDATADQVAIAEDALAPVDVTPQPTPAPYPGTRCAAMETRPDGVAGDVCTGPGSIEPTPGASDGNGQSGSSPGSDGTDSTMVVPPNETVRPVEPITPCTLPEPGPNGEVPLIGCADPGDVPVQP
jgi:hypothetical protein